VLHEHALLTVWLSLSLATGSAFPVTLLIETEFVPFDEHTLRFAALAVGACTSAGRKPASL